MSKYYVFLCTVHEIQANVFKMYNFVVVEQDR